MQNTTTAIVHRVPLDPHLDPFKTDQRIIEWRIAAAKRRAARRRRRVQGFYVFFWIALALLFRPIQQTLIAVTASAAAPAAPLPIVVLTQPTVSPLPTPTPLPPDPSPPRDQRLRSIEPVLVITSPLNTPALPTFFTDACVYEIKRIVQGESLSLHNLRGSEFVASQVFYTALDNRCNTLPKAARLQDTWNGAANVPTSAKIDPLIDQAVNWVLAHWNLLPWQRCDYVGNAADYWTHMKIALRTTPGLWTKITSYQPVDNPLAFSVVFPNMSVEDGLPIVIGDEFEVGINCDKGK